MTTKKSRGNRLVSLFGLLAVSMVLVVGCAGLFQDQLIFFPDSIDEDEDLGWTGASEVFVEAEDGARIHGLMFETADEPRGVILYFHGNAGSVATWYRTGQRLTEHGVDVFLIDYRTYGKSTGEMSEQGLYMDGRASYDYLVDDRDYDPESVVVHGRSLGSAVATRVATEQPVGGVILETPFIDLKTLASDLYPFLVPTFLLRYELNNYERSPDIDVPTWVVQGTDDEIVPADHAEAVYRALGAPWDLTLIEGGRHNNLMSFTEYDRRLGEYFDDVLGQPRSDDEARAPD